jgi:hypothetical protein
VSRRKVKRNLKKELDIRRDGVAYLLSIMDDPTAGVGIFGSKVCQVCGEIEQYQGQWGAAARHRTRPGKDGNEIRGEGSFQADGHATDVEDSDIRYCEVCRESIPLDQVVWVPVKSPLCKKCRTAFSRHAEREEWTKMLIIFVRNRELFHRIIELEETGNWGSDGYARYIQDRHSIRSMGEHDKGN